MIKFDINTAIIEFEEEMINYNEIRKQFKIGAKKCSDGFQKNSLKKMCSSKELIDYASIICESYLDEAIIKGVEVIVGYKVITIDVETFRDKYCTKNFKTPKYVANISKNIASGKAKKNNTSSEYIKRIRDEITSMINKDYFNVHLAVVEVLLDENIKIVASPLDQDRRKRANALINNYKDGFINDIDTPQVVNTIINLDPYRIDFYKFLLEEDGDFNKDIERLVSFIGEDIKPYKEKLITDYINNCIRNDSDVDFIKEKVTKYCKYMGISNEEIYLTRIDAIYMFANA